MKIKYTRNAAEDIEYWKKKDPSKIKRIKKIIDDIQIQPFTGIGKPEPLKNELSGKWSRRITAEHRLIYEICKDELIIFQCRFHY